MLSLLRMFKLGGTKAKKRIVLASPMRPATVISKWQLKPIGCDADRALL